MSNSEEHNTNTNNNLSIMNSLREEIDQLLYEEMFEPYGISQTNFIRDGVLRILEKRIDEYITKNHIPKKYSRTPQSEYDMCAEQALEDFKKELLK